MKKAGFKTAMFSSNGYVSSKWGFDRGWDVNRNFIRESLPNGSEYLWKTAKAWLTPHRRQAAVRLPRDHRAARRVHAAARSSWSSTGTSPTSGRSSRCCRACSSASSRPASSRSTTTTRSTSRRCTTPRSRRATPRSRPSSPTSRRWASTTSRRWSSSPITATSSTSTAASATATPCTRSWCTCRSSSARPASSRRARSCSADVEVMDLYATLLDLAGVQADAGRRRDHAWCRWRATRWAAARAPR